MPEPVPAEDERREAPRIEAKEVPIAALLHVIDGPDRGRLFRLSRSQVTIGRNPDNTIVLADTAVSGNHAKIVRSTSGTYTLHDLSSTNGCYVNQQTQSVADLHDDDRIQIGETTFAFEHHRQSGIFLQGAHTGSDSHIARGERHPDVAPGMFRHLLDHFEPHAVSREDLERAYVRNLLLERLDAILARQPAADGMLAAGLEAALSIAGASRGLILWADDDSGEILPTVTRDLRGDADAVPFHKPWTFEVITSGRGSVFSPPPEDAPFEGAAPALCAPLLSTGRVTGAIYLSTPLSGAFSPYDLASVEAIGRRVGTAVDAAGSHDDFQRLFSSMIDAIMRSLQAKDVYTRGHSERVRHYSKLIARELRLPEAELERVTLGAALHDIGKIGMPDEVLKHNKNPRLSPEQLAEVKKHPLRGAEILRDIPFLRDIIPAAELHHEDWDGTGYPHGLQGQEIPLLGRIVAVADTYDAITTDRPYQKGKSYAEGFQILRKIAGQRLEPELVEAFVSAFRRYRKVKDPEDTPDAPDAGGTPDDPELSDGLNQTILVG